MTEMELLHCHDKYWVPIVQGNLLHSTVDPIREAKTFIDRHWKQIENVQSVVVVGLGGGFHIEEILQRKKVHIVVIECLKDLVVAIADKQPQLMKQLDVLASVPPSQLILEPTLLKALSHSYFILKHPASLRVHHYYYAAVIESLSSRTLLGLKELSQGCPSLNQFLDSLDICGDQTLTLPMVEEALVRRGSGLEKEGLIWMALRELVV